MFTTEIKSLSILTSAANLSSYLDLYIHVLGGKEIMEYPGMHIIEFGHQSIIELYVEGTEYPGYLFENSRQVPGFRTENLKAVYEALAANGFTLLSPLQQAGDCYAYFHAAAPHGEVISLHQLLNNHNKH
jgi:hypothetical protein